jgi:transposase
MNANTLLADPTAIEIVKFVSLDDVITIVVSSIQPSACCPLCHQLSCSLKTRYLRRVADLPWHNVAVRLELHARKFRCRNDLCARKVFCERLPKVVAPFARRTVRLSKVVELLSFALGARATAQASAKLSFPIEKDACLRTLRRSSATERSGTVRVLGVDDFAFRRGHTYGTILVDLERRQPIDMLPDRTAETLALWLKAHPKVEIVSRDRSSAYADAARTGAPQAEQVADRWHLLKNLGNLVERFFVQNHCLLTQAAAKVRVAHLVTQSKTDLPFTTRAGEASDVLKPIPARRQKTFDSIKELQASGKTIRGIARELKVARNTVRRYIKCETVPRHHSGAGRRSSVRPFAGYLQQRWREGEHNGLKLWTEIKTQGYGGEVDSVQRFVREWRKTPVGKSHCAISSRGLSPRQAAKLLLNPESVKGEAERMYLAQLREISPRVLTLQRLGIGFQQMVKEKRADLLDGWLRQVKASGVKEVVRWAEGLLADEAAVRNALSLHWSNGQVEGQVNRLKTIKRAMYGRAKFDLLRARVLHRS